MKMSLSYLAGFFDGEGCITTAMTLNGIQEWKNIMIVLQLEWRCATPTLKYKRHS